MMKLSLIIGLTILYYIVLFYIDQQKRKAFKAKQQAIMAQTAKLPVVEEKIVPPNNLLGGITRLDAKLPEPNMEIPKKKRSNPMIKPEKTNKPSLMDTLKETTDMTSIREEETMAYINSITKTKASL